MSLGSLAGIQTATIKRVNAKQGSAMGQIRTGKNDYTTDNRGTLPTSSTGRLVQGGGDRRLAYEMHDLETPGKWYTTTNPQLDESDLLVVNGVSWFVQNQSNPDTLSRYFIIDLKTYTRGLQ